MHENKVSEDVDTQQVDDYSKYFAITQERRNRFHWILNNKQSLKFKLSKVVRNEYKITNNNNNNSEIFSVETRVTKSKALVKEPTVWSLETIIPQSPQEFEKYIFGENYRLKWDKQNTANQKVKELYKDNKTKLFVSTCETKPAAGGIISPRQFTGINQIFTLGNKNIDIECIAQSIKYKDFGDKKGCVRGYTHLSGMRVTKINTKDLKELYKVPVSFEWCKLQLIVQMDLNGWLPTKIVETATSGGLIELYHQLRFFLLQNSSGFDVKTTKNKK